MPDFGKLPVDHLKDLLAPMRTARPVVRVIARYATARRNGALLFGPCGELSGAVAIQRKCIMKRCPHRLASSPGACLRP